MPTRILLRVGPVELTAELNDSPTSKTFSSHLPLEVRMSRWGEEYYGSCGLSAPLSPDAREEMAVGELAFWPPGQALCVFFGTPAPM